MSINSSNNKSTMAEMKEQVTSLSYPDLLSRRDEVKSRLEELRIEDVVSLSKTKKKAAAANINTANLNTANVNVNTTCTASKDQDITKDTSSSSSDTTTSAINKDKTDNSNSSNTTSISNPTTNTSSTTTIPTDPPKPKPKPIPYTPKTTDTQWDYLLKEMQWLSADFQSERKRQVSLAKKQSYSIDKYHSTIEKRRIKSISDMELKRKRIASKLAKRVVKGWWQGKVERVIGYCQRVEVEEERKRRMDRHLVFLVRQTERYSSCLDRGEIEIDLSSTGKDESGSSPTSGGGKRRKRIKKRVLTIEQALQLDDELRSPTKNKVSFFIPNDGNDDDNNSKNEPSQDQSNRDDGGEGDDHSEDFTDQDYDEVMDDETTIAAEEKLQQDMTAQEEIALLEKENEMSVEELRALYLPSTTATNATTDDNDDDNDDDKEEEQQKGNDNEEKNETKESSKLDNDDTNKTLNDDGSNIGNNDKDDAVDFVANEADMVDDETTIAAEEKMKQEMTAEEEIALLEKENEMSVEELRGLYLPPEAEAQHQDVEQDEKEDDEDVSMDKIESTNKYDGQQETKDSKADDDTEPVGQDEDTDMIVDDDAAMGDDNVDEDAVDFVADEADMVDDETTIAAEEKMKQEISAEEEIALLQKENDMSVEELRALYLPPQTEAEDEQETMESDIHREEYPTTAKDGLVGDAVDHTIVNDDTDTDDGIDFKADENDLIDDETTIAAEESMKQEMTAEEEINLLKRESEMSVEELRAMYLPPDNSAESEDNQDIKPTKRAKLPSDAEDSNNDNDNNTQSLSLSLESFEQKLRNTNVSRPFLLTPRVKLRAYQHIGLNWLVSIQTRRLNGILADEMGLGKTLQTISLLSYLACYKGIWGPHLVIVPTSCIVNWEMEIKRFCPSFKVLCYYGSAKRRKELRQGWKKANMHHIIITSYQLVVQDAAAFKRKKWYYMILDEAQNIKNFQSQRWNTLVSFNTQRRLLLTGTPLQNNLMELWSLLHFLMPYVFRSRKDFSYWFSDPMNNIIEGNTKKNDDLISRLHGIIRPFILRRLKKDVETQMPNKYEHIVKCQLSRRQMFLYEEFMSRSSTRETLQKGGNYMGMMTCLMQLRKVCNHPDLFEPRSILTPFYTEALSIDTAACVTNIIKYNWDSQVSGYLSNPIWSMNCGMPDSNEMLAQNFIKSSRINQLQISSQKIIENVVKQNEAEEKMKGNMKPGLKSFLEAAKIKSNAEKVKTAQNAARINSWRCTNQSFPYSQQLIDIISVNMPAFEDCRDMRRHSIMEIAETPSQLLAMKRLQQEQEDDYDKLIQNFVFCVPSAGAKPPTMKSNTHSTAKQDRELLSALGVRNDAGMASTTYSRLSEKTRARLSSFFPDKKLIQYDAGKLQTLAKLLRELKQGSHRVLIFTQMSKVLDILETFLNLNGHTYLRLDGATGVEQRQRLMDRFNNDQKVFCFILSTRSGGLGINLTGADTVIFYDNDWNPAMDAQAQDRAHRIGQTRDVHIYRLVTEHSVEENILTKAQQKRQLDFMVMDEGKFYSSAGPNEKKDQQDKDNKDESDVFTKTGLRSILVGDIDKSSSNETDQLHETKGMSKEQIENAMTSLEDEDDVLAMQGARKEVAEELEEFNESVRTPKDDENDGNASSQDENDGETKKTKKSVKKKKAKQSKPSAKDKNLEVDPEANDENIEKEFAAWQSQAGVDKTSITASLTPTEQYAVRFKEHIDPFYSAWSLLRYEEMNDAEEEIDIEAIETEKAAEEQRAIEDGDLLATQPLPEELPDQRSLYLSEKSRLKANKIKRKLTGEDWETRIDGKSKHPFWYNSDTGEAVWDKPKSLVELHAEEVAHDKKWNAIPINPLTKIMEYLIPFPERMNVARVCKQFRLGATHPSFVRHVFPVEMGSMTMDPKKMDHNHYRDIVSALSCCLPGDTIELGDGHYWINEEDLVIDFPLRIIGDEKDPTHVVVELRGSVIWKATRGWIEGVTLRRPKINSSTDSTVNKKLLKIEDGNITISNCSIQELL